MPEPIIPRSIVLDKARQAVNAGHTLERATPWPPGSAAGQLFQREFFAQQAFRAAELRRKGEGP